MPVTFTRPLPPEVMVETYGDVLPEIITPRWLLPVAPVPPPVPVTVTVPAPPEVMIPPFSTYTP